MATVEVCDGCGDILPNHDPATGELERYEFGFVLKVVACGRCQPLYAQYMALLDEAQEKAAALFAKLRAEAAAEFIDLRKLPDTGP